MPRMPTKMKLVLPPAKAEACYQEVIAVLDKHFGPDDSIFMLLMVSQITGKIMALMDRHTYTREQILDLVIANIEQGNADMIEAVVGKPQGGVN